VEIGAKIAHRSTTRPLRPSNQSALKSLFYGKRDLSALTFEVPPHAKMNFPSTDFGDQIFRGLQAQSLNDKPIRTSNLKLRQPVPRIRQALDEIFECGA